LVPSLSIDIPVVAWKRRGAIARRAVVVVARELDLADVALGRHALAHLELEVERRAHLDRGAAALAVALREVRVADREQRSRSRHRNRQPYAFAELLDVQVAAGLSGRDGAQRFGGDARVVRDGVGGVRGEHRAAAFEEGLLAGDRLLQQLVRRREADHARKGCARDAYTR
jgi:hypothetical protein